MTNAIREALQAKLKTIIVEQLGVAPCQVTSRAKFADDLGADSLDTVELVMAFEEEFNAEIHDEDAEKIETVQDAFELLIAVEERTYLPGSWLPNRMVKPIGPTVEDCASRGVPSPQAEERLGVSEQIAMEILIERGRQIREEGYTPESDDAAYLSVPREQRGQLAYAAGAYAGGAGCILNGSAPRGVFEMWPWAKHLMKIDDARRMLIKSAALILAQIEQLDRQNLDHSSHPMRVGNAKELVQHSGTHDGEETTALEKHPPGAPIVKDGAKLVRGQRNLFAKPERSAVELEADALAREDSQVDNDRLQNES